MEARSSQLRDNGVVGDHEDDAEQPALPARDRLAFLLRASELLSESLDYEETLRQVADLAVPTIADWCSIDLVDPDGGLEQVAVSHVDPDKRRLAQELRLRFPPDPNASTGTAQVVRTGRSELYGQIDDALLDSAIPDQPELQGIVRELGLVSAMTVPLIARERVLGAITFVAAESGHRYGREDVRFAEDLARRAALAIDTARRFGQQAKATVRSEERFHLLVDNVRDYAIFMLDPDGNVVTWNEGAKRINGYEAYEIIGQHFSRFYTQDAIEQRQPERELEVALADGRYEEEAWRVRKDGSRYHASVVMTTLYDEDGTLRGFAKVTRDITERLRAERDLAAATAEVERQRVRRAHALEIHDNVIQSLVLAKYAHDAGDLVRAAAATDHALAEARRIVGDMQDQTGLPEPGDLRRREGAAVHPEKA
jgi:PAS domain S-box-containing protein